MKIHVNIERLILDGIDIPAGQRPLLQAAVETELARLLSEGGLHPSLLSGGSMPGLRVNAIEWSGENDLAQLGQQIARSVYSGIGAPVEKTP
jgi:hypothetical protein